MSNNELIENFWIERGGKPSNPADLSFYESSWDMLMPVVHNILHSFEPSQGQGYSWEYLELEKTRVGNKIEYVYKRVVLFIKWYNQTKPK